MYGISFSILLEALSEMLEIQDSLIIVWYYLYVLLFLYWCTQIQE